MGRAGSTDVFYWMLNSVRCLIGSVDRLGDVGLNAVCILYLKMKCDVAICFHDMSLQRWGMFIYNITA